MNVKHSLICLLLLLFLVSCTDEDRTLTFSDVTYVRDFPEHCTVIESTKVPLDLPGLRDIKLKDSILFYLSPRTGRTDLSRCSGIHHWPILGILS